MYSKLLKERIDLKKRNQIFNYLYALAIIMVIDDHTNSRFGIMTSVFPYNSFYMPLFVFCSGYFYKQEGLVVNLKHKIKKLLLPYLLWNLCACILALDLDALLGLGWFVIPTLENVILSLFGFLPTSLNGAAWFVNMLFWVSILYNGSRIIVKINKRDDLLMTVLFFLLGILSTLLCVIDYWKHGVWAVFALKILFYIQFYHYGYMFRRYGEEWLKKYNRLFVCCLCILVNIILITIYGTDIEFPSTTRMSEFDSWYLPIITSTTGIVFYYELTSFLAEKIGPHRIIDFISRNTFVIMQVHLLFTNIPNFVVYSMIRNGSDKFADFNIVSFMYSAWYRYNKESQFIGFFCGVAGSLLVAYILEKIRAFFKLYIKEKREQVTKSHP